MLVSRPPQPVGQRREVAAVVVATRLAATIAPGHVIHFPAKPVEQGDPPDRRDGLGDPPSHNGHDTPV